MEMVGVWKWAATVAQMDGLKLWLSPKKRSLRLRLPSCSPGTLSRGRYVSYGGPFFPPLWCFMSVGGGRGGGY